MYSAKHPCCCLPPSRHELFTSRRVGIVSIRLAPADAMAPTRAQFKRSAFRVLRVFIPCVPEPVDHSKQVTVETKNQSGDDDDDAKERGSRSVSSSYTGSSPSYTTRSASYTGSSSYSSFYSGSSYSSSRSYSSSPRERGRNRNDDDDDDDDDRSVSWRALSVASGESSVSEVDTQATLSDSSVKADEEEDVLVGAHTALEDAQEVGDLMSSKIECGPEAAEEDVEGFMRDIALIKGSNPFGGGARERDIFKAALVKQIVLKEGEYVLREGESWMEEARTSRAGDYAVYFVVRGALAATKLVHPRYASAHTKDAMKFIDDPMSILRPIKAQIPHLNNDTESTDPVMRQRAVDLKRAENHDEVEVAKFVRGGCFGEYEVFHERAPRRCSVRALVNNTAVAVMPIGVFERFARPGTELRARIDNELRMYV